MSMFRECPDNPVDLFLSPRDIDVNSGGFTADTPVIHCILYEKQIAERLLMRNDIVVDNSNFDGVTALMKFVRYDKIALVKMILAKPDVDANLKLLVEKQHFFVQS